MSSTEDNEIFKKAVRYILTEWPSLNLAIENGMGGCQAKDKRDWMCETVAQALLKDGDIDLEEYLTEMINQEFDTIIEDGSLEYNVRWINKFYKDCNQGKSKEVMDSINLAASKKVSLDRIPPPVCATQDTTSEEGDSDDESDEN